MFYDYKDPLNIPDKYQGSFDVVFADPPFLSKDCFVKVSKTVKYLMKDKVIVCTGKGRRRRDGGNSTFLVVKASSLASFSSLAIARSFFPTTCVAKKTKFKLHEHFSV